MKLTEAFLKGFAYWILSGIVLAIVVCLPLYLLMQFSFILGALSLVVFLPISFVIQGYLIEFVFKRIR